MAIEREDPLQFNISTLELIDWKFRDPLRWSMTDYAAMAKDSQADGLEWHQVRGFSTDRRSLLAYNGKVDDLSRKMITRLHQSFRGEKWPWDIIKKPGGRLDKAIASYAYFAMPLNTKSLGQLETLQDDLGDGQKYDIIVYPEHLPEGFMDRKPFKRHLVQIQPELINFWQIKSLEHLKEKMQENHFDGFCLDLTHIRRPGVAEAIGPLSSVWDAILEDTYAIHAAAGRFDSELELKEVGIDTYAEAADLLYKTEETSFRAMLRDAARAGWTGAVTTEIPTKALAIAHDRHNDPVPLYTRVRLAQDRAEVFDTQRNDFQKVA